MLTQEQSIAVKPNLGAAITLSSSRLTYFTVFFLVDHGLTDEAYKAYAYFRWVDDTLDKHEMSLIERMAFIKRENTLIEQCYRVEGCVPSRNLFEEETLLVDLIRSNPERKNGLYEYIHNLMNVMEFDAQRRGKLISQAALSQYEFWLAKAVTEALHFYIGHDCFSPLDESRYLAATAAHITHMLRDTYEDNQAGYYNIPREVLDAGQITPLDVDSQPYRDYVKSRVELARMYFKAGKRYLAQVKNLRCRLAGYSYMAHFLPVLNTIEREGYRLRPSYA